MNLFAHTYRQGLGILDSVVEALKDEGDEKVDLSKLIESPEKLENIGQKLFAAKPGLRERAEKQILDLAG